MYMDQSYVDRAYINRKDIDRRGIDRKHIDGRYSNRKHVDRIDRKHIDKKNMNSRHINRKYINRKYINEKNMDTKYMDTRYPDPQYTNGRYGKKGKRSQKPGFRFFCIVAVMLSVVMWGNAVWRKQNLPEQILIWMGACSSRLCMPLLDFAGAQTDLQQGKSGVWNQWLSAASLLDYEGEQEELLCREDQDTLELLLVREGSDEDYRELEEGALEYQEDALHIHGDMQQAMEEENRRHMETTGGAGAAGLEHGGEAVDGDQERENSGQTEDPEGGAQNGGFQKALEKSYAYNWEGLRQYEDIVSAFYAIDSTTSITDEQLNLENLLGRDMRLEPGGDQEGYQILVYHTHSQEAFADSVAGDPSTTIVGAGEKLSQLLEEKYGYRVLHHTGTYDADSRDYAYSNSLPAIQQILAENPQIQVVIDLHRDAMPEGKKLVVELDGRPTAQFMFFNGLSRSREKGAISYLDNPNVNENLAFSFQAQVASNEYYPGLTRRIYLKAYRYNMHLAGRYLLVELGAQTNTVEEIMNACDPLAHVIAKVLSGETGDQARAAAGIELDNGG